MGGIGSGRYNRCDEPKPVAEDYGLLDASKLSRMRVFTREWDDIPCLLETRTGAHRGLAYLSMTLGDEPTLQVNYQYQGVHLTESIALETTQQRIAGVRWWFTCPMFDDQFFQCGRRVAKLYLKGGFGCRQCHNLTYESCRQSHRWEREKRATARLLAESEVMLERVRRTYVED